MQQGLLQEIREVLKRREGLQQWHANCGLLVGASWKDRNAEVHVISPTRRPTCDVMRKIRVTWRHVPPVNVLVVRLCFARGR